MTPHCGPGSIDPNEICGFCGESQQKCAKKYSEFIQNATEKDLIGYYLEINGGYGDKDKEWPCGGSGFWCPNCNRFWAQDSCGESGFSEHQACDGAELEVYDRKVHCVCGRLVAIEPEMNDLPEVMIALAPFYEELQGLGFEPVVGNIPPTAVFTKSFPGLKKPIEIQLWIDGGHRVCGGTSTAYPTDFKTVEEMREAIETQKNKLGVSNGN